MRLLKFEKICCDMLDEVKSEEVLKICNALNSEIRMKIYQQLFRKSMAISEIAELNDLTISSSAFHAGVLEGAGLIEIVYAPSKKGNRRICHVKVNQITFSAESEVAVKESNIRRYQMPVGHYTDADLAFVSGFCTKDEQVMFYDGNYFTPERMNAELIWCSTGFVEYSFPSRFGPDKILKEVSFSLEICSETVHYCNNWKSEITFSLNGVEILTYISPGDFGDRRGELNPEWWPDNSTQYGQLKKLTVNENGVYLNGELVSARPALEDLRVGESPRLAFKIENKADAEYRGGFNIFGKGFGDYPQDIVMTAVLVDK